MSSDESEYDEDYVPSETGSVHSDSDSDGEEGDEDVSASKKRRKNGQEDTMQTNGDGGSGREKTEDELWNEFLGIDASGPDTTSASKDESVRPVKKNDKKPISQSVVSHSAISSSSSAIAADSSSDIGGMVSEEPKNLFGDESPEDAVSRTETEKASSQNDQPSQSEVQSSRAVSNKPAGIGSLLEKIETDKKLTTLEKSRQDWEGYKTKQGISEELSTHNRGKGGYLEKKEFLERSDYRQFEKERDMRLSKKRKSDFD